MRRSGRSRTYTAKVNHLPTLVSQDELTRQFAQHGHVSSVEIKLGAGENYAFVNYLSEDDARGACDAMDGQVVGGGTISVKMQGESAVSRSTAQYTVKVSCLSKLTKEEAIESIFGFSGTVPLRSVKIVLCPIQAYNFAYVNYPSRDAAARAERELNGLLLDKCNIRVKCTDTNGQQTTPTSPLAQAQPTMPRAHAGPAVNPHAVCRSPPRSANAPQHQPRVISSQTCAVKVSIDGDLTIDDLTENFGQYGSIKGVPRINQGTPNYAYINFSTPEEACRAATWKGLIKGVKVQAKLAVKNAQPMVRRDCKELPCDRLTGTLLFAQHKDTLQQFKEAHEVTIGAPNSGAVIRIWGDPSKLEVANVFINALLVQVKSRIQHLSFTLPCHCVPLFKDQAIIDLIASIESEHCIEFGVVDCSPQTCIFPLGNFREIISGILSKPSGRIHGASADSTDSAVVKVSALSKFLNSTSRSLAKFQWLWEDDDGDYSPYTPGLCDELNKQFAASSSGSFQYPIVTRLGKTTYEFNFAIMTQTNMQTKNSRRIKYAAVSPGKPQWSYRDDNKQFVPYTASESDAIESMYKSQHPGSVIINGTSYTFDFPAMKQINTTTLYKRSIKRDHNLSTPTCYAASELCLKVYGLQASLQPAVDKVKKEISAYIVATSCPLQGNRDPAFHSTLMQKISEYFVTAVLCDGNIQLQGVQGYVEHVAMQVRLEIVTHQSKAVALSGRLPQIPVHWQQQSQKIELMPVGAGSSEWNRILHLMQKTLRTVRITCLERVQNEWLWDKYAAAKERMSVKNRGVVNEKELFHGTKATPPEKIYKSELGFDFRFASKGMWGEGAYFAVNASYSHNYSYSGLGTCSKRQMILALVLTGETHRCPPDSTLKMPPVKRMDGAFADERYDSVNGQTNGSEVFIIYDFEKAYPAYVITYTV